jgi:hypothetical protein
MVKILLTILALIYTLSPYDILPDFFVGWGWLDDLILLYFLWRFFYSARQTWYHNGHDTTGNANTQGHRQDSRNSQDPYQVLGIAPGAGDREIKHAYRQLALKYHPDKVQHLGEEFRKVAEQRFQEIQAAYQTLTRK